MPRFKIATTTHIKKANAAKNADLLVIQKKRSYIYTVAVYHVLINFDTKQLLILETPGKVDSIPDDTFPGFVYLPSVYILKDKDNICWDLVDYNTPCMEEDDFIRQFDELLPNLTPAEFNSISEMINSDDRNTVELGVDMLINYNIKTNAYLLGELLIDNGVKLKHNPVFDSVVFTHILERLRLTKRQLENSQSDKMRLMKGLDRARYSGNEEELRQVKDNVKNYLNNNVNYCAKAYVGEFPSLDFNYKVEIW